MERKEGYESRATKKRIRFACCVLHFSRLTNKFIRSLHNFVKSLSVYMKIVQAMHTLLDLRRTKKREQEPSSRK
jgi:hypothetical protein